MKLNNKGFSLIEVLAVIVILGVLATITIPTIGAMINENKEASLKSLKKSIKSAAKAYVSDYRYEIDLETTKCGAGKTTRSVNKIGPTSLTNSRITAQNLINEKLLTANENNKITNPKTNTEINPSSIKIEVKYSCAKKDFEFGDVEGLG
jgi:prepilin-type N-terminal cleavage/methylation domain-containing protein